MSAEDKPNWLLRYVVTAETAVLISMIAFFATGYQNLVKNDELSLMFPWPDDKPFVVKHMQESESALKKIGTTVQLLNDRLTQVNHEHDLRLAQVEFQLGQQKRGR